MGGKLFIVVWLVLLMGHIALASVQIDGVAAFVNQHVITISDVLGASETLQQQLRSGRAGLAANEMYAEVLQDLIDRKLIVDSYQQQKEIQIPSMVVDERVQEVVQELFQDDRTSFLRALGEEGRSERSWREDIRQQVVVRAMRNLRVDRHIHISPTEIRAWYDANPDVFMQEAEVTYRMLVVDTPAQDDAEHSVVAEITGALEDGEDFEALTRRFSIDRFAERGGLRGPVDPQQLRDEVRHTLESLDVGAVSDPIVLGGNTVWLQLEAFVAGEKTSFAEAYDDIRARLFRQRAEELYDRWIQRLRAEAFITVAVDEPF